MLNWFRLLLLIVLLLGIVLIYGYQHLTLNSNDNDSQLKETKSVPLPSGPRVVERPNRTVEAGNQNVAIFAQVPKAGSEMFKRFGMLLSSICGYHAYIDPQAESIALDFVQNFGKEVTDSGIYYRQMAFVNFSQFGAPRPIYVSVVRNPVERMASWFYATSEEGQRIPIEVCEKSAKWRTFCSAKNAEREHSNSNTNVTFDECVLDGKCFDNIGLPSQLEYFGQDLREAKANVEQIYSVVGVLEDLSYTLAAFEAFVPKFFRGATEVFNQMSSNSTLINPNPDKKPMTSRTKVFLEDKLNDEVEFYEFCRQKLHKQGSQGRNPDWTSWPDQIASNAIVQLDDYILL